jgi:uncharacterized protein (TIGR02246 family)
MPARTPEEVDRLFEKCLNAGDVEGIVALYEPEGTLLLQEGEPLTGPDAIRGAIAQFVAMRPHIEMTIRKVVSGGGDVAVVYNDWRLTLHDAAGQKIEDSGKASEIVRRQADGTWRFVIDDPRMRG